MSCLISTAIRVLCAVVMVTAVRAADISVSAELSRPEISAGEMAELQIKVTGAQQADVPQQIAAEGLQIRLTGQSTQVQMVNFRVTSSAVYSYIVMPLRTGSFSIPGITVTADGRQFRTSELKFSVSDTRAAPAPAQYQPTAPPPMPGMAAPQQRMRSAPTRSGNAQVAFGEIICPKRNLFVGEVVPVELRYYFDASYQVQVRGAIDFAAEGIVTERFGDPKESREERDGTVYNVLSFHTLLSAVKPGPIDIPAAKLDSQIQMPGAMPPGFDDPVFQQLMGGRTPFNETKDLAVRTAPLHLEILPLPKEGRPDSFSGAVGQFDIDAIVANPRPAPGDPVTLSVKIAGKGNFNGMGAPLLTGTEGWRSYPPTDRFEGNGDSASGLKTFDFTLIATEPRQTTPGVEFSYFDPVMVKYVTLTTKPLAVTASPGSSNPPAGVVDDQPSGPKEKGKTSSVRQEIKEGEPYPTLTRRSWTSPVLRLEFHIATLAMLIAAIALAGVLGYRHIQSTGGSERSRRRRRIACLASILREGRDDSDTALGEAEILEAAIEYAELAIPPSEQRAELLVSLRHRHDQLKYGLGGSRPMEASDRARISASLATLLGKSSL